MAREAPIRTGAGRQSQQEENDDGQPGTEWGARRLDTRDGRQVDRKETSSCTRFKVVADDGCVVVEFGGCACRTRGYELVEASLH